MTITGGTAKSLARGPLGIIAVFALTGEGILGAVLVGGKALSDGQRWAIIAIAGLLLFGTMILFVYLLLKHTAKLYPPRDFRSDEAFFQGINVPPPPGTQQPTDEPGPVPGEVFRISPEPSPAGTQQPTDELKLVHGEAFGAQRVILDGKRFVECSFHETTLVVQGRRPISLDRGSFLDVKWEFEGPAANAINFLQVMRGEGEYGKKLVENTLVNAGLVDRGKDS